MEANAGRLESQSLNDSERELPLKRAAEVARTEAHRLRKLIEEINRVLDEAEQTLVVSDEKPFRTPSSSERPYFQDQYSSKLDLDYMLARFDYARRFPTSNNSYCNPSSLSYSLEPPLLGDAPSSGLEKTLSKIPDPWGGTVDIHAAPYTGELYVKDNYWGQVKVDPVNENAAILAGEARRPWSPPIEARKDYYWSGHYTTTTWYGQANFHRRNPLGAPDPSSVPETGYLGYW